MALEGIELNSGSGGLTLATDRVGGFDFQIIKIGVGADDSTPTSVSDANPMPVDDAGGSLTVDNAGTFVVQEDGAALTALQLIDDIVQAEDAVHGSGDSGVMALAVRNDVLAALAGTDGDYAPLQVNASGALYVEVDGTVTVGSHAVTNAGTFVVQEDGAALTALQLIDNIVSVEDAVHGSGDSGVMALAVRNDTLAALAGADGDYAPLQVNASGALFIQEGAALDVSAATLTVNAHAVTNAGTFVVQEDGAALTALQLIDNIVQVEDAIHGSGDSGVMALAVRNDVLATLAGADGDYAPLQVNASGALFIQEGTALDVSAATLTVNAHAVTNAGTFVVQEDGAALTALQLIDDPVFADDDAFTLASSKVSMAGAIRDDALTTLTAAENDAVPLRVSSTGALHVTGSAGITEFNEDDASAGGEAGNLSLGVRQDADTSPVSLDGDFHTLIFDATGNLKVNVKAGSAGGTEFNEDAAHSSGAAGTLSLGVRRDADTSPVNADLDYHTLIFDNAGNLKVNVKTGAAGGVTHTDDAAFTAGTDDIVPAAGFFNDSTPDSVDEGDAGVLRMSANRNLYSTLRDAAGNERGVNVDASNQLAIAGPVTNAGTFVVQEDGAALTALQLIDNIVQVEDAVHGTGDSGVMALAVRNDVLAALVDTDGDYAPLQVNASGAVYVAVTDVIPGTGATNLGKALDSVVGSTDTGVLVLAKHEENASHIEGAEGDYAHFHVGELGALWVSPEQKNHLDEMDATTGWAVLGNDAANLATTTKHLTGTAALTFDKVNGAANTVIAGIAKTITALDLGLINLHDIIQVGFYIPSLADVSYVFCRVGTDSTNYNEWRIPDTDLTAATFEIAGLSVGDANHSGITGNGWDPTAITYIAVGIAFDSEADTLAGIIFDQIGYFTNSHSVASLGAEISSSVNTANINLQKVGGSTTDKGSGNASNGSQRVVIATDDVNMAAIKTAVEIMDDWDETNRAAVNLISSQAGVAGGTGVDGATVLRVTLATDIPLPAGTAAIGKLAANSGVDIGDVDVLSVLPGTGANNLGKTEDTAHSSLDVGVMALVVRRDADTTLVNLDGDYAPLQVDANGKLKVEIFDGGDSLTVDGTVTADAGTGTFNIQATAASPASARLSDGAAFYDGTKTGQLPGALVGGRLDVVVGTALPAGTNNIGDVDVLSVVPGTGATDLGKAVDAMAGATDTGVAALAIRDDALTTLTPVDGDYVPLRVNSTGALHVTGGGGGTEYNEDDVTPNPIIGTATLMERDDALTAVAPAEADWIGLRGTAEGALWVQDFNSDAILADTNTIAGAVAAGQMQVDIVAALPSGTNNIGDVDILSIIPGTGATDLGKAIDTAAGATDTGVAALAVRDDSLSTLTPVDGDYVPLRVNSTGALHIAPHRLTVNDGIDIGDVTINNASGASAVNIQDGGNSITVDNGGTFVTQEDGAALTALQLIDDAVFADDDPFTLASSKVSVAGAIRDDALSTLTAIEGDVVPLRVSSTGALHVTGSAGITEFNEDTASAGGEAGNIALGVRRDADTSPVTADNDFHTLIFDATGNLKVNVKASASHAVTNAGTFVVQEDGAALTALQLIDDPVFADNDPFTFSSSKVMVAGAIRDDVLGALIPVQGDAVPLRVNSVGALHTTGGGEQHDEDAPHTTGDTGTMVLVVRNDVLASLVDTDGDYVPLQVNATGALYVEVDGTVTVGSHAVTNAGTFVVQEDGAALAALQLIDDPVFADDAAFALTTDKVMMSGVIVDAALSALAAVDGDAVPMRVNANGALHVTGSAGVTEFNEDAPAAGGEAGNLALGVRRDADTTPVSADGDFHTMVFDSTGNLKVDLVTALPAGTNAIGKLAANSGVDIGDVDILGGVNGTASGALGAENDAVTLASQGLGTVNWEIDTGTLVGTVSFEATLDDANWFAVNIIRIDGGIVSSTSSFADRGTFVSTGFSQVRLRVSSFTSGTSNARMEGSLFHSSVVRLGQALPGGSNTIGEVTIGTATTAATDLAKAEDAVHGDNDVGVMALAVRKATPANLSGTDGDYEPLQVDAGRLWVSATIDAALPSGTNEIGKLAANSGVDIGDVDVTSQPARASTTDSIKAVLATDTVMDGTTAEVPIRVAFDVSASGDNQIVALVASNKIRVLSLAMNAFGDVEAEFQSGGTTTNLSGTFDLGTSAGKAKGLVLAFSPIGHFESASGTALDLNLNAAIQVSGHLVYIVVAG